MEPVDDYYTDDADTRNVKSIARSRGKKVAMVTKSYSHKAVQKIMYAKQERDQRRMEAYKATMEAKEKASADAAWADPVSDKREKKLKEKAAKAEEKTRKKLEKLELSKAELANGHSKKKM